MIATSQSQVLYISFFCNISSELALELLLLSSNLKIDPNKCLCIDCVVVYAVFVCLHVGPVLVIDYRPGASWPPRSVLHPMGDWDLAFYREVSVISKQIFKVLVNVD